MRFDITALEFMNENNFTSEPIVEEPFPDALYEVAWHPTPVTYRDLRQFALNLIKLIKEKQFERHKT